MKTKLIFLLIAIIGCVSYSCDENSVVVPEPDFFVEELDEVTDARNVNHNEILRVVKSFQPTADKSMNLSRNASPEVVYNVDGEPCMYVINYPEGGFIVISAVKDLYPVLAYNTEGYFDTKADIPGLKAWMKEVDYLTVNPEVINPDSLQKCRELWEVYEKCDPLALEVTKSRDWKPGMIDEAEYQKLQQIFGDSVAAWNARRIPVYYLEDIKRRYPDKYEYYDDLAHQAIWPEYEPVYQTFSVIVERYEPMYSSDQRWIKTSWYQTGGFNQTFGPRGTNLTNAYAGCGPVAAGQIMFYHKWPSKYNWADMPLNYGTATTSNFLLDIALQAKAEFNDDGTGTIIDNIKDVFTNNGYSCKSEEWDPRSSESKLEDEIESGKPVYCSSYKHAFVLAGISKVSQNTVWELWTFTDVRRLRCNFSSIHESFNGRSFYINWGWGGVDNGYYFSLQNMHTSQDNYSVKNYIYNIKPNK